MSCMRILLLASTLLLSLVACDSSPGPEPKRYDPVVVYASYDDEQHLPALFAGFTEASGIPVTVRHGDATTLSDDVIANRGSPPADVLLTTNVADVWRASDEAALRPIAAENFSNVHAILRDPDQLWVAMGFRVAVIMHGPDNVSDPETYADLAAPPYRGQLCLSSSSLPVNRSLIAMLIAEFGTRPAERIVRGWMRNLALPPFSSEAALLEAIDAGTCGYGIVSSHIATARHIVPRPAYVNIEGLGIARHARSPESAQKLVDWMLSTDAQSTHARGVNGYPVHVPLLQPEVAKKVSAKNVGLAGWHENDAELLSERAGYR